MGLAAIETRALNKIYVSFSGQKTAAVRDLSIRVEPGETFGFLGPNGAGKTTTIKILLGLCQATSGQAWVLGQPVSDPSVRARIGFVPESPYYYDFFKAEELLGFYGKLYGLTGARLKARISACLDLVRLSEFRKTRVSYFSRGMLQRIGIAQSLLNEPEVLILDEPTGGLDPIGQMEIRELLLGLKASGKTILLCSHELSKVEVLSDRVAIMDRGKLLTVGDLHVLTRGGAGKVIEARVLPAEALPEAQSKGWKAVQTGEATVLETAEDRQADEALRWLLDRGATIASVTPKTRSLEEVFLSLVQDHNRSEKE